MSDKIKSLNAELDAFRRPGGLFDVPPNQLDLLIGRRCRFRSPTCEAERENYTVATTQKNHLGEVMLRVVSDQDTHNFGRLASIDQLTFGEDDGD